MDGHENDCISKQGKNLYYLFKKCKNLKKADKYNAFFSL
jgi:hypothetical protein